VDSRVAPKRHLVHNHMTRAIRVAMLSKSCVVGVYQGKLEQIASHGDIVLMVDMWIDRMNETYLKNW